MHVCGHDEEFKVPAMVNFSTTVTVAASTHALKYIFQNFFPRWAVLESANVALDFLRVSPCENPAGKSLQNSQQVSGRVDDCEQKNPSAFCSGNILPPARSTTGGPGNVPAVVCCHPYGLQYALSITCA